jgi:hypothetical protein
MKKNLLTRAMGILLIGIASLHTACSKKADPVPPPAGVTGKKSPIGTSDGESVSKTIGAEGGTIMLPDTAVVITVPAGALTTPTTITIEPVTNTNVAGVGKAFRLTPHGTQFKKPVAITFSYAAISDSVTLPAALGLAYQGDDGVWQFTTDNTIDTVHKTITYHSSHFSDWSMMQWLSLKPIQTSLGESEEVTIQALQFIPLAPCHCDEDLVVPLPSLGAGYPVGDPVPLDRKYIGSWQLAGTGTLIPTTGNQAVYKAPPKIPFNTTATVSCQLKSAHTLILVSNVVLLSDNTFELRINGGPWRQIEVALTQLQPGQLSIATPGVGNDVTLTMFFPQRKGTSPWGDDASGNVVSGFFYAPSGGSDPHYSGFYEDLDGNHYSGGNMNISVLGGIGEFTTGTFTLNPSGYYLGGKQKTTDVIEGRYKLKRSL